MSYEQLSSSYIFSPYGYVDADELALLYSVNDNNNEDGRRARPPALTLEGLFRRLYEQTPRGQNPVLPIGGQQLAPYVHTHIGQQLLARPGAPVPFVRGSISTQQIKQHRPSYINALLIQSRGIALAQPCMNCRSRQAMYPFTECRHVPGAFSGACGNCKWPGHARQCSVQDEQWDIIEEGRIDLPQGRWHVAPNRQIDIVNLDPEPGEQGNPINLDAEEGDEGNPIIL